MSQLSAPQDGILTGDATQAPYSADEWGLIWSKINGFASRANFGVVFGYDNGSNFSLEVTQVTIASANVEVKVGAALVTGTLYWNDSTVTLAIAANSSGNPRIDTVVLRKDYVAETIRLVVRQGTPAGSPVAPTLTQSAGTTWEIPLADIAVANGFSTIVDANITMRHEFCNVGNGTFIDGVLNNSGADLDDGDVVIWDTSGTRAVTTTTTSNHWKVAGVWRGHTATGSRGRMQVRGIGRVKVRVQNTNGVGNITLNVGTVLVTGYVAKKATNITIRKTPTTAYGTDGSATDAQTRGRTGSAPAQVGIVLSAPTTANNFDTVVLCYIDVQQSRNPHTTIYAIIGSADAGTFTSGSFVTVAFTHMSHGGELFTSMAPGASFTSNNYITYNAGQLTIQPGRYFIRAKTPGYRVDGHHCRFQDITNGVTVQDGHSAYSPSAADSSQSYSDLETFLIIETATVYELQKRCATTRATDGKGKWINFGDPNMFDVLEITRFDEIYT